MSNKAAQHASHATNLEHDVLKPLEETEDEYVVALNTYLHQIRDIDKNLDEMLKNLNHENGTYEKAKKAAQIANKALDDLKIAAGNGVTMSPRPGEISTTDTKSMNNTNKFFKKVSVCYRNITILEDINGHSE